MTQPTIESVFLDALKRGPVLLLDNMRDKTHAATNDPIVDHSPLIRLAILAVDLGADPADLLFNSGRAVANAFMYNVGADCPELTHALNSGRPALGFHYCSLNAMYFVDEVGAYGQRFKAGRVKDDNPNVTTPIAWIDPQPARFDRDNALHMRVAERIREHFESRGWVTAAERLGKCMEPPAAQGVPAGGLGADAPTYIGVDLAVPGSERTVMTTFDTSQTPPTVVDRVVEAASVDPARAPAVDLTPRATWEQIKDAAARGGLQVHVEGDEGSDDFRVHFRRTSYYAHERPTPTNIPGAAIVAQYEGESGRAAGSRADAEVGRKLLLRNADNTGVRMWTWRLLGRPDESEAQLEWVTSSTARLTPDVPGSYLIGLTVTGWDRHEDEHKIVVRAAEAPASPEVDVEHLQRVMLFSRHLCIPFDEVQAMPRGRFEHLHKALLESLDGEYRRVGAAERERHEAVESARKYKALADTAVASMDKMRGEEPELHQLHVLLTRELAPLDPSLDRAHGESNIAWATRLLRASQTRGAFRLTQPELLAAKNFIKDLRAVLAAPEGLEGEQLLDFAAAAVDSAKRREEAAFQRGLSASSRPCANATQVTRLYNGGNELHVASIGDLFGEAAHLISAHNPAEVTCKEHTGNHTIVGWRPYDGASPLGAGCLIMLYSTLHLFREGEAVTLVT